MPSPMGNPRPGYMPAPSAQVRQPMLQPLPMQTAPMPLQPSMPLAMNPMMNLADGQPRPKVRMLAPEPPPPPRKLTLPSPESLGVTPVAPAPEARVATAPAMEMDWNELRTRLQRLGAVSFRLDRLGQNEHRVIFLLPTGASAHQHVEAVAPTEGAAVALALQQAESWALARK